MLTPSDDPDQERLPENNSIFVNASDLYSYVAVVIVVVPELIREIFATVGLDTLGTVHVNCVELLTTTDPHGVDPMFTVVSVLKPAPVIVIVVPPKMNPELGVTESTDKLFDANISSMTFIPGIGLHETIQAH